MLSTSCTFYRDAIDSLVLMAHRVTSLRLIKPQMDIDEAVRVALGFEQRTLFDSPDKVSHACVANFQH